MYSNLIARLEQRLQPLIGPLTRRFSRPSYRWHNNQAENIGALQAVWSGACILDRTRTLFTVVDLRAVPAGRRLDALRLELEQQAPFESQVTGWVIWQDGFASVWYWPQSLTDEVRSALPGHRELIIVPEGALWPELSPGQGRWLEQPERDLYLLQYRSERSGLQEQRFTRPQSADSAQAWLRRHGANGALPEVPAPPPGVVDVLQGQSLEPASSTLEHRILPMTALFLGALLVVYLIAWGRLSWSGVLIEREYRELQAQTEPLMAQRTQVNEVRAVSQRLSGLLQPSQTLVAARLAESLDIRGGRLIRWEYRDRRVMALWRPEDKEKRYDTTQMIERLEAVPGFDGVQAQVKSDGALEVSLQVIPTELEPMASHQAVSEEGTGSLNEPPEGERRADD